MKRKNPINKCADVSITHTASTKNKTVSYLNDKQYHHRINKTAWSYGIPPLLNIMCPTKNKRLKNMSHITVNAIYAPRINRDTFNISGKSRRSSDAN